MPRVLFHSRLFAFVVLGGMCLACTVPIVPQPPRLTIAVKGKGRIVSAPPPKVQAKVQVDVAVPEVEAQVAVEVDAQVQGQVEGEVAVEPVPPVATDIVVEVPTLTEPVPLEGAAVVEFFGIPLVGAQDVVFVLDRSGSMEEYAQGQVAGLAGPQGADPDASLVQKPRKIDVAHAELVDALERLPVQTRMNVLYFNNRLQALYPAIAPLHEDQRGNAVLFVRQTVPDGRTALAPAMRTAFLMNARRIVLLSDGLGNIGGDAEAVLRDAREAMRGGVRIDTIGLGADQDAWLLGSLAKESGGIYQSL